jgi:integrase
VTGAKWDEVDFDTVTWVIPAERMKAQREHRVPLSDTAVKLLRRLPTENNNPFIFLGPKTGGGLNKMSLSRVMQRMGRENGTVHGFRSAFSDWAHEQTAHSNHTIEISLAHTVGNEVERAYRRKDMLTKRVRLMAEWSRFCDSSPVTKTGDDVVPLRRVR